MKRFLFTLTIALIALAGCKKETPQPEPIAVTSVSLDKTEVSLIVGESANVKAIVKPDDAANKEVKWTVANTSIATVDEGEVTAVAVGETTLKVTTVDGGHTATIPVKVTAKAVKVSQIKLVDMPTTDFEVGRSVTIKAVITPDDATDKSVTFTSSNPEVATVEYTKSENNYSLALLKAVGPGKATITATANDGSGVKAEAEVTVTSPAGGGSEPTPDTPTTIVFKTSKAVGETITLGFFRSEISKVSMDGAKAESDLSAGDWGIYTCKLSSQTVTIKGDITVFDCKNNGITEIALTKDLRLFDFNCSDNELTSLDVSGLTELESFACSSNKLTSLNIEGCENLYYLECYSNSIKDEAMTNIVNDLPKLDTPGAGSLVVTAEGCGNVITAANVATAKGKNWDVVDDKYHEFEGSGEGEVDEKPIAVIKLVGMPTTDFKVGRSVTISAVITPDDATDKSVTFTSSNPEVATVEYIKSENNYSLALLKAVGPGKATITATANDGSGVKAEAEVTVIPNVDESYYVTFKSNQGFDIVVPRSEKNIYKIEGATVTGTTDIDGFSGAKSEFKKNFKGTIISLQPTAGVVTLKGKITQLISENGPTEIDATQNKMLEALELYEVKTLVKLTVANDGVLTYIDLMRCVGLEGTNATAFMNSLPTRTAADDATLIVKDRSATFNPSFSVDDIAIAQGKNWKVIDSNGEEQIGKGETDEDYYITFKSINSEIKIAIPQSEKGIYKIEGATVTNTHDFVGMVTVEGSFMKDYKHTELTLKTANAGDEIKISGKITGFIAIEKGLTEVDASHNKALELLYIPRNPDLQKLVIADGGDLKYLHLQYNEHTGLINDAQTIVNSLRNDISGALFFGSCFTTEQYYQLLDKGWKFTNF